MLFWPSLAALICLFLAAFLLYWLCVIDLKMRLLPDELNAALAITGLIFLAVTMPYSLPSWWQALAGAALGGGLLWVLRAVSSRLYGFETMGLGDVKLMAAAGLWLGAESTASALALGAFCGVLHGVAMAVIKKQPLRGMTLPAGPGFCMGVALTAAWQYWQLPFFAVGQ